MKNLFFIELGKVGVYNHDSNYLNKQLVAWSLP
jgi:hypothetical protein